MAFNSFIDSSQFLQMHAIDRHADFLNSFFFSSGGGNGHFGVITPLQIANEHKMYLFV
jgi:hypothetical protein